MTEHEQGIEYQTGPSIGRAFDWVLGADCFADSDEVPDDEARAIEIGNIYSYALNEGLTEDYIEGLYREALGEDA